ncbi:MAG: Bax inhibitor-1/YccA family protein [Balneola sp.]|nr:Bax inhibitor-1/YccA family protein [Balneola sp.]MBO6651828.1 Bax inhibitor-1/YccA family protein [Balneola sp.]MBO6710761.1 Bax inhibitor-1/YccA family protein [Balneola sp.]MBO6799448.1 Bax inhibitor-1/YccA family protein [Balneola sp.]MBO6870180.1 Bax inhibitor-1/YccA family protein [Balneola sp.]
MNQVHQLTAEEIKSIQTTFINKVYVWMGLALTITGIVALRVADSGTFMGMFTGASSAAPFYILIAIELGLVWWMVSRIDSMSSGFATALFVLYSALNGVTLSVLFYVYTSASIASTFFITAGTFGICSAYGYFTKKDLTSIGGFLFMAIIGIIIATIVNIFLASSTLYWIISYAGVAIFIGLTAYDTQKIKNMSLELDADSEQGKKGAVMGALALYLDFINMFIFLLRIFGNRR